LFYSFFNLGARWGWVVNVTPRPLYPRERDPVPIVQEAGWVPRPVWADAKNIAPTRMTMTIKLRLENTQREKSTSQWAECTQLEDKIITTRRLLVERYYYTIIPGKQIFYNIKNILYTIFFL
jgi:hypothetical protein